MCLDTAIDMNEILNTVMVMILMLIDLVYEKIFIMSLVIVKMRACIYLSTVPTLSEESATPMIAAEDPVDHILKNPPPCGRNHVCAHL